MFLLFPLKPLKAEWESELRYWEKSPRFGAFLQLTPLGIELSISLFTTHYRMDNIANTTTAFMTERQLIYTNVKDTAGEIENHQLSGIILPYLSVSIFFDIVSQIILAF